jgi:molecular chaperone DnaJ
VSKRDYYEVLGVEDGDRCGNQERLSQADEVSPRPQPGRQGGRGELPKRRGHAVLADGQKRAAYDRFGHQGVNQGAGGGAGFDPSVFNDFGDFADILGGMFGFGDVFGGSRRRGGPQRGSDLRYDLEISFEEAAKGTETAIQIPRQENCEPCAGSGAAPGTQPTTCTMQGAGTGPPAAGVLHHRDDVPHVSRRRAHRRQAVPELPRHWPHRARAEDHGEDSGRYRDGPATPPAERR